MMTYIKAFLISCAFAFGTNALAQTPAHDHDHDHATPIPPQGETQAGVFAEIEGDHAVGAQDAPVTIIIYASVTCPHCASWFSAVWPNIKKEYVQTGKVRAIFREFPTKPVNLSMAGFQLAHCAAPENYMSVIEHIMSEQENTFKTVAAGKGLQTYLALARSAGIDNEADMNACFQNQQGVEHIRSSSILAQAGGIASVPGFIINGTLYRGNSNYLPLSRHLEGLTNQDFTTLPKP